MKKVVSILKPVMKMGMPVDRGGQMTETIQVFGVTLTRVENSKPEVLSWEGSLPCVLRDGLVATHGVNVYVASDSYGWTVRIRATHCVTVRGRGDTLGHAATDAMEMLDWHIRGFNTARERLAFPCV